LSCNSQRAVDGVKIINSEELLCSNRLRIVFTDYQQIFNRFIDSLNILGLLMPKAPKPPAQDAGFKDCGSILRINTRFPPPLFLRPVSRMNIEKAAQSAHENRLYFPIS